MRLSLMMIASAVLLWGCSADPYSQSTSTQPGAHPSTAETPVKVKVGGYLQAGVLARP